MDAQNQDHDRKDPGQNQKMPLKGLMVWLLLLALFVAMYQVLPQNREKYPKIPYNPNFIDHVQENEVRSCKIVVEV